MSALNTKVQIATADLEKEDNSLMELRFFIASNKISMAAVASDIGVSVVLLRRAINVKQPMPFDMADQLQRYFQGKICLSIEGMMLPWELKKLRNRMYAIARRANESR